MVFKGSGECAEVLWTFLGLSIPGWTLVMFTAMTGFGLFFIFSRRGLPAG
jgi:disulfide bond formation protein DsbB